MIICLHGTARFANSKIKNRSTSIMNSIRNGEYVTIKVCCFFVALPAYKLPRYSPWQDFYALRT